MDGYGILDNSKAETSAAEFSATPLIDSVEAFKKMFQMLWLYTWTVVAYGELVKSAVVTDHGLTGDFNERCIRAVGYDIVYDVAEDAIDKAGVSGYHDLRGHLQAWCDPFFLERKGCVVEDAANNLHHIHILVFITIAEMVGVHLVEPCQRTHVEQQLVHALALGIAAFQKMLLLILRYVGIIEDALQIAVDTHGGRLQFVGGILRELALQSRLVFLGMPQLPVEHDDGVADVAQLVVGQMPLQFVIQRFAILRLDGNLAQITYMSADAASADL